MYRLVYLITRRFVVLTYMRIYLTIAHTVRVALLVVVVSTSVFFLEVKRGASVLHQ